VGAVSQQGWIWTSNVMLPFPNLPYSNVNNEILTKEREMLSHTGRTDNHVCPRLLHETAILPVSPLCRVQTGDIQLHPHQ